MFVEGKLERLWSVCLCVCVVVRVLICSVWWGRGCHSLCIWTTTDSSTDTDECVPVGHGQHALLQNTPDEERRRQARRTERQGSKHVRLASEPGGEPFRGRFARGKHLLFLGLCLFVFLDG